MSEYVLSQKLVEYMDSCSRADQAIVGEYTRDSCESRIRGWETSGLLVPRDRPMCVLGKPIKVVRTVQERVDVAILAAIGGISSAVELGDGEYVMIVRFISPSVEVERELAWA